MVMLMSFKRVNYFIFKWFSLTRNSFTELELWACALTSSTDSITPPASFLRWSPLWTGFQNERDIAHLGDRETIRVGGAIYHWRSCFPRKLRGRRTAWKVVWAMALYNYSRSLHELKKKKKELVNYDWVPFFRSFLRTPLRINKFLCVKAPIALITIVLFFTTYNLKLSLNNLAAVVISIN